MICGTILPSLVASTTSPRNCPFGLLPLFSFIALALTEEAKKGKIVEEEERRKHGEEMGGKANSKRSSQHTHTFYCCHSTETV